MRWEGGLIAYFNLLCPFVFPTPLIPAEIVPTLEKLRMHNAVPNI